MIRRGKVMMRCVSYGGYNCTDLHPHSDLLVQTFGTRVPGLVRRTQVALLAVLKWGHPTLLVLGLCHNALAVLGLCNPSRLWALKKEVATANNHCLDDGAGILLLEFHQT
mmetsp:Transcript_34685/g.56132  ORF Transcript_34685/g.56132 Transcript_34685/m.56132 type:complete len:110 (-) Transcript_34685:1120-1449(-)